MAADTGISPRSTDYSQWYLDVIEQGQLARLQRR
jgi:hypothetical protein